MISITFGIITCIQTFIVFGNLIRHLGGLENIWEKVEFYTMVERVKITNILCKQFFYFDLY